MKKYIYIFCTNYLFERNYFAIPTTGAKENAFGTPFLLHGFDHNDSVRPPFDSVSAALVLTTHDRWTDDAIDHARPREGC